MVVNRVVATRKELQEAKATQRTKNLRARPLLKLMESGLVKVVGSSDETWIDTAPWRNRYIIQIMLNKLPYL